MKPGPLFEKFTRKDVTVRILVVNPTCPTAIEQANADDAGDPGKARAEMKKSFQEIREIFEHYSASKVEPPGSLTIRATSAAPHLTLYIRDRETVIFGYYFRDAPGDQFASMRLDKSWNGEVYDQFQHHFESMWTKAENAQLLYIKGSERTFNQSMYDSMLGMTGETAMSTPADAPVAQPPQAGAS